MTYASLPTDRFTAGEFRLGQVLSRSWSVFSGNILTFMVVTGIASLPTLLLSTAQPRVPATNPLAMIMPLVVMFLAIVLGTLSQAIVLYGAFQAMRGRPVRLADCLRVGLNRFLPIIGLALSMGVAMMFASILLVIPGLILYMMWFVATPACVVEQLGPFRSMSRSRELTRGHRWKLFGLCFLILIPALVVGGILSAVAIATVGTTGLLQLPAALATPVGQAINLIWSAAWGAFYAVMIVVTYHDLRVAKEGIDTERIAAVFE